MTEEYATPSRSRKRIAWSDDEIADKANPSLLYNEELNDDLFMTNTRSNLEKSSDEDFIDDDVQYTHRPQTTNHKKSHPTPKESTAFDSDSSATDIIVSKPKRRRRKTPTKHCPSPQRTPKQQFKPRPKPSRPPPRKRQMHEYRHLIDDEDSAPKEMEDDLIAAIVQDGHGNVNSPTQESERTEDEASGSSGFIVDEDESSHTVSSSESEASEAPIIQTSLSSEEAFPIYIQFLASCILEAAFEKDILTAKDPYYTRAVQKVERDLRGRCDSLAQSGAWSSEFRTLVDTRPLFISTSRNTVLDLCAACHKQGQCLSVILGGEDYDAHSLWNNTQRAHPKRLVWRMAHYPPQLITPDAKPVYLGRHCRNRVQAHHTMVHYKLHLILDLKEALGDVGRSGEDMRESLERLLDDSAAMEKWEKFYQHLLASSEATFCPFRAPVLGRIDVEAYVESVFGEYGRPKSERGESPQL
eukprot:NODE_1306_length_1557_cov_43.231469_g1234_i0.p1 GENE.NODE_1306_length_1557_cov_43.231469_g1234_i0~~NODE_1306_length_1557_cov_43.231469_g1234_i0.p1  ORF type:complete len:491 (-),score=103.76 NODE_1306_length_1557_cov_43.231469_g1234_i0:84-1493(-)